MEANTGSVLDSSVAAQLETARDVSEAESMNQSVEEMFIKVDQVQLLLASYNLACTVSFLTCIISLNFFPLGLMELLWNQILNELEHGRGSIEFGRRIHDAYLCRTYDTKPH